MIATKPMSRHPPEGIESRRLLNGLLAALDHSRVRDRVFRRDGSAEYWLVDFFEAEHAQLAIVSEPEPYDDGQPRFAADVEEIVRHPGDEPPALEARMVPRARPLTEPLETGGTPVPRDQ